MKLKREREIHKLLPQTHSTGVDYSLFIMETVEMSLGGDGDHAGSAPPEFSPSNLQLQVSVSVFLSFGSVLFCKTSGDYFYSRF